MSDFIVVATFLNRHEAEIAKGLLSTNAIQSMISPDDCGGMKPGMSFGSAITLTVNKIDLQKAKEILDQK